MKRCEQCGDAMGDLQGAVFDAGRMLCEPCAESKRPVDRVWSVSDPRESAAVEPRADATQIATVYMTTVDDVTRTYVNGELVDGPPVDEEPDPVIHYHDCYAPTGPARDCAFCWSRIRGEAHDLLTRAVELVGVNDVDALLDVVCEDMAVERPWRSRIAERLRALATEVEKERG